MNFKVVIIALSLGSAVNAFADTLVLRQGTNQETVPYAAQLSTAPAPQSEIQIVQWHQYVQKHGGDALATRIQDITDKQGLDHWSQLKLVEQIVAKIRPQQNPAPLAWYLLNRLGFESHLMLNASGQWVSIRIADTVYTELLYNDEGKLYLICQPISSPMSRDNTTQKVITYKGTGTRVANLHQWQVPAHINQSLNLTYKTLRWKYKSRWETLELATSRGKLQYLDQLPYYHWDTYTGIPTTSALLTQLDNYFIPLLSEENSREQFARLLSFCRTALVYGSIDELLPNEIDKPMTPEQTLFANYSDCEDRVILFNFLVQRYLGRQATSLQLTDHLVSLVEATPADEDIKVFTSNGKRWLIMDPTGPSDALAPGEISKKYELNVSR